MRWRDTSHDAVLPVEGWSGIRGIVGGYATWAGSRDGARGEVCVEIRRVPSEEKLGDCLLVTTEKTPALVMEAVPGEVVAVMTGPSEGARRFRRKLSNSGEGKRRTKSRRADGLCRTR